MPDPSHSAGPGAELQPDGGLETPDVAEAVEAKPRNRVRGGYGPAARGRAPEQGELGVEDLLEDDDESMIHRFDFGLQLAPPPAPPPPKSIAAAATQAAPAPPPLDSSEDAATQAAPEAPPQPPIEGIETPAEPPLATAEPAVERFAPEQQAELPATEDATPEAEAIEAQLELEDRYDWAFSRGQHFAEAPRPAASKPEAPEPPDPQPESTAEEPTTALPMPEPPAAEPAVPEATEVLQPPQAPAAEAAAPPAMPAPKSRPKGPRRVEKRKVPAWLSAALVAVVVLGAVAVWGLLRSLETDNAGMTVEEELQDLAEGAPSEEPPIPAGDVGPGIEFQGMDVVAEPARTELAPGDGKLVLGAGGEPVVGLQELLLSEPSRPAGETTEAPGPAGPTAVAQPGAGTSGAAQVAGPAAQPAGPKDGRRAWEPLVRGAELPGWQSRSREGWSVKGDLLTVRTPPDKKSATVLWTDRKYRNLAFTFKARPETAATTFGLLTRAQSGAAVRLEFAGSKGTLKAGEALAPVIWEWKPGQWHQVALIAVDKNLLVYIDRRKVATLAEVTVDAAGRLGVYCTAGQVEFRAVYVQPLD